MRKGLILSLISAILCSLSFFPFRGHSFFILIGFSPVLYGIEKKLLRTRDFFIWGLVFHGITGYWIIRTVKHYGYTNYFIAIISYVLLTAYLALYPLLAGSITGKSKKPILTFIALYPLSEWIRSFLFGGFPIVISSHALSDAPLLLQSASLLGQLGIALLIMLSNLGFSMLFMKDRRGIILVAGSLLFMSLPFLEKVDYEKKKLRIAIIQPNIGEEEKWNPITKYRNIEKLTEMIKIACSYHPDIIVTPETTYPIYFSKDPLTKKVVDDLKDCSAHIIIGAIDYTVNAKGERLYLNKALNIYKGSVLQEYTKNILVPFGEYVPLRGILTRLIKNVSWPEDFERGRDSVIFDVAGYKAITPICFEICFPEYIAKGQKALVISLTNDMWFGRTIAPYLHLWAGIPRSVENRAYIIRSANTGISAIIDPKGRKELETPLFQETIAIGEIESIKSHPTIYQQYPYLSQILLLLILLRGMSGKRFIVI